MPTVTIDKNDRRLKAVKFLTSCMDLKDGRFHTRHFKVEADQSAVATDGHRLHWVSDLAVAPGYYQVHKNNKTSVMIELFYTLETDEGSFPDYTDLLSIPEGEGETFIDLMLNETVGTVDKSGLFTNVIRAMKETTLNFNYVSDIYDTLKDDVVSCIVPAPDENETCRPVHFRLKGFHAVVMPRKC